MQLEKIGESVEIGQGIRHTRQLVMPEIEHAEFSQAADLIGNFGQIVVGQNQGFEIGLVPHGLWDLAEVLLPEVQIRHTGDASAAA